MEYVDNTIISELMFSAELTILVIHTTTTRWDTVDVTFCCFFDSFFSVYWIIVVYKVTILLWQGWHMVLCMPDVTSSLAMCRLHTNTATTYSRTSAKYPNMIMLLGSWSPSWPIPPTLVYWLWEFHPHNSHWSWIHHCPGVTAVIFESFHTIFPF